MPVSVFELFRIGIGPSSSHTVGPMRAVRRFLDEMVSAGAFEQIARIHVELYGSLALTGKGHGTDRAVLLGLLGDRPESIDVDSIELRLRAVADAKAIALMGKRRIPFDPDADVSFRKDRTLPQHANGMCFRAYAQSGTLLMERVYFSVGGGFVLAAGELGVCQPAPAWVYDFCSGDELLCLARQSGLTIAQLALANETVLCAETDVRSGLDAIWEAMNGCIERGLRADGVLPGGFNVRRRAKRLYERLLANGDQRQPLRHLDWVDAFAMAVNEENAAGGRVVTAPTNGAAGIIPAVLRFYEQLCPNATKPGIHDFLLTAAAIGSLYRENASISGAEVGCQGEVGVASSMAAAGLTAAFGGSNEQIENAAEIGMEHNLGLTCDPVGGLVQIPCIERNAMGAVKAINAAYLALSGDGSHHVSLDKVIETMRQTGRDMQTKYKETSLGGLAVNVVAC